MMYLNITDSAGRWRVPTSQGSQPEEDAVLRFVEQFALLLTDSGMPRMSARVFAFVLADDAERYTAHELARGLRVSPAAISGAVRHLVQIGLLGREREPGARTDTYRVFDDDVWYAITMQREEALKRSVAFLAEGVKLLDRARPGGRRVRETLEYYRFMREELPQSLERWRQHRRTVFSGEPSDSNDDR
jgi:DNA-binding transcriptional regulator GbsR (MarR family)